MFSNLGPSRQKTHTGQTERNICAAIDQKCNIVAKTLISELFRCFCGIGQRDAMPSLYNARRLRDLETIMDKRLNEITLPVLRAELLRVQKRSPVRALYLRSCASRGASGLHASNLLQERFSLMTVWADYLDGYGFPRKLDAVAKELKEATGLNERRYLKGNQPKVV